MEDTTKKIKAMSDLIDKLRKEIKEWKVANRKLKSDNDTLEKGKAAAELNVKNLRQAKVELADLKSQIGALRRKIPCTIPKCREGKKLRN